MLGAGYKVIVSKTARADLENAYEYILFHFEDAFAAQAFSEDVVEVLERLRDMAGSYGFCRDPELKARGYRATSFKRHQYKVVYHISGNTIFIDRVFHHLQDYENALRS